MAFNFVVETGEGNPDANSYASVEFADDYVVMNPFASAQWALLDREEKEHLLARASLIIDRRVKWAGERVHRDSGLRWPRAGVLDEDGFLIPDDEIPDALIEATVEFATYLMSEDWTQSSGTSGFKEIKVDVIELVIDETKTRSALPDTVMAMLDFLGAVDSGRRPAFKKIVRM